MFLADAQHHALFHRAKLEFTRLERHGGGAKSEHLVDLVALLHSRLRVLEEGGDVEAVGDQFRHFNVHAVDVMQLNLDRDDLTDVGGRLGRQQADVGILRQAVATPGLLPGGQHPERERLGLEQSGLVPELDRGQRVVAGLERCDQDVERVGRGPLAVDELKLLGSSGAGKAQPGNRGQHRLGRGGKVGTDDGQGDAFADRCGGTV